MDLTPTIQWLEKLNDIGAVTLLGLILCGNFYGIWVWGKVFRERVSELESAKLKLELEKNEWKSMALGLLDPLEKSLKHQQRRNP